MRETDAVPARLLRVAAAAALAAVGAALFTQHVWDMQPCPWCVLQRLIFVVAAALALPGALSRSRTVQIASGLGLAAAALAGLAAALWQHFVAAASVSCNLTLADRILDTLGLAEALPQVFAAYASCADAKVNLAGLPYEFWSGALFVAGAVAGGWVVVRRLRG